MVPLANLVDLNHQILVSWLLTVQSNRKKQPRKMANL